MRRYIGSSLKKKLAISFTTIILGAWLPGLIFSDATDNKNCVTVTDQVPYIKIGNTFDKSTYNGYRRFNGTCLRCHGQGGVGSTFAPALVDSLKVLTKEQFVSTVTNGKSESNKNLIMPAFANDPDVMLYMDDIYSYLKARANGDLGIERPEKNDSIQCRSKSGDSTN